MVGKRRLKKYLSIEMDKCEKIIDDYEDGKTDDENAREIAEAKLEALVGVMDLMNWDIK